jgi:hypothetical protein
MADTFSYNHSLEEETNDYLFQNKQFLWIPDVNNGSYLQNQIVYDLAAIANSGRPVDLQQSFIEIPLVMVTTITTAAALTNYAGNEWAASLKNGFWQLINSIDCQISNNSVINLTANSNIPINFKMLTTASQDDVAAYLPSLGSGKPDNADSIGYTATNFNGIGEYNNQIAKTSFAASGTWGVGASNDARLERMKTTSFNPDALANFSTQFTSSTVCQQTLRNYCTRTNGTTTCTIVNYITAHLPLKFLHDLFSKMPLVRGMFMRLTLNLNANCQSTAVASAGAYTSFITNSQYLTFPCMMSPIGAGQGIHSGAGGNDVTGVVQNLGIAKSYGTGTYTHPLSVSRFYACTYEMSPLAEESYFSSLPTKLIKYNDLYCNQTLNVAAGTTITQLISNSISRLRGLLIVPMLSGTANLSSGAGAKTAPSLSPFSTSPATSCPHASIGGFNVLVSGTPIYAQNYVYNFESFINEFRKCNSINGGSTLGLNSGLIDENAWNSGYKMWFVDLSRHSSEANDNIGRSLQVNFTNTSVATVDYYYFVFFEREFTISTSTGSLII